jgi:hypothetical protein
MDWFVDTMIIVGLFILRFGVPLVLMLILGYLLHKLDEKWQPRA